MNQKVRDARKNRATDLVEEVENAKDDTGMFKAAKALHMKHQKIHFVHDDQERYVSQPKEVQKIIEQHFMSTLTKKALTTSRSSLLEQKRLNRKITVKEVKAAVWKMINSKAPGKTISM